MKRLLSFSALFLLSFLCFSSTISGNIFVDKNSNGAFDKGDEAVAGVVVSDQINTTKTNDQGIL
jgi:hypothetical protein